MVEIPHHFSTWASRMERSQRRQRRQRTLLLSRLIPHFLSCCSLATTAWWSFRYESTCFHDEIKNENMNIIFWPIHFLQGKMRARTNLSGKVPVCYAVQSGGAANITFFQQRVVSTPGISQVTSIGGTKTLKFLQRINERRTCYFAFTRCTQS